MVWPGPCPCSATPRSRLDSQHVCLALALPLQVLPLVESFFVVCSLMDAVPPQAAPRALTPLLGAASTASELGGCLAAWLGRRPPAWVCSVTHLHINMGS